MDMPSSLQHLRLLFAFDSLPDFYHWAKVFEARSCFAGCELPIDTFLLFVPRIKAKARRFYATET